MNKNFIFFSILSLVLVLFVILAGSLVRMTGSGMGCPDWPKCFGYLIPPTNIEKITWKPNQTYNKGVMILHDKKFFNSKNKFISKSSFESSNWIMSIQDAFAWNQKIFQQKRKSQRKI